MPSECLPVAPSENPETAALQLEDALRDLAKAESTANPRAYRPYLLQLIGQAWEAAASGVPKDMEEDCELVERVRTILEEYILPDLDLRTEAALEVLGAIRFLQTGIRALANRELKHRDLKANEQKILRVLEVANTYLQRKDVHRQLEKQIEISPPRVGQILSDLFHDGYLLRYQAPAQGGLTSFYALSPLGKEALSRPSKLAVPTGVKQANRDTYERLGNAAQFTAMAGSSRN
jgi:DNA-binding MarR family transcriptional regulator